MIKNVFVKLCSSLFPLIFLLITIKCEENSGNSLGGHPVLVKVRELVFPYLEIPENYVIKTHRFFKDELKIQYPLDLLIFIFFGMTLNWMINKISNLWKREYIYNAFDELDYSTLISNVKLN
jgi:hypothetical protein